MQANEQVAGEAREKLADKIASGVTFYGRNGTMTVFLSPAERDLVLAALRAQPERGAEEMAVKAFQERAMEGILNLRHAAACNFSPEYSGAAGEARCDSFLEAYKIVRALPLHPDKEGGGR